MTALSTLRALLAAGTQGEWTWELDIFDQEDGIVASVFDPSISMLFGIKTGEVIESSEERGKWTDELEAKKQENWKRAHNSQATRDAALIVAAINGLGALLDVAEAAEEALTSWEGAHCIVTPPCGNCVPCRLAAALGRLNQKGK
jgi:hypothetical protein